MFNIYEFFSKILDWGFVCKTMMIVGSKNSRLSMHFQNESKILINMIFFLFGLNHPLIRCAMKTILVWSSAKCYIVV